MKNKLKQIFYDLRHQPVVSWVTLIATTLSIFLIMVIVVMQQSRIAPFSPESCRERLLIGAFLHTEEINNSANNGSAGLSYHSAQTLYDGLEGVEHTSYFTLWPDDSDVKGPQSESFGVKSRRVDAEFFNIFDHKLVDGRFFTEAEANANLPVIVVTESTARQALGDISPIGAQILVNQMQYRIIGVVKDHSSLATTASGDVFFTTGPSDKSNNYDDYFGALAVALLVKDGVDFEHIRDQVKKRYAVLDGELAARGERTIYHESPFDREAVASGLNGSNVTPDPESDRNVRLILYAVMLLVPAINLSSMLHSRLRRRINEIGVRRAFGCTRSRVILDIISENFILTLAGGIVGIILSLIFATTFSGLYENMENFGRGDTPALSSVFSWSTVFVAIGFCFVLNIISASIPAWQASRMNPVNALNRK